MNAIPLDLPDYGPDPYAPPTQYLVETGDQNLGSGHFMRTLARFIRAAGKTDGVTTTRTVTWLGGYTGGVYAILADQDDLAVAQSSLVRYGVDGTIIGRSSRTDAWNFTISPSQAQNVRALYVFHTWAPDNFLDVVNDWLQVAKPIAELIAIASGTSKPTKSG